MCWIIKLENKELKSYLPENINVYVESRVQDSVVLIENKAKAKKYATQWDLQNELCYLNFLAGKGSYVAEPVLRIIK